MQLMLDTATDTPADLYRIGKYLADTYAVTEVPAQDARPDKLGADAAAAIKDGPAVADTAPPPPPPPVFADVVEDSDPEITIDDAGSVTQFTVSTELTAAVPPPPPPPVLPPPQPAPPGPAAAAELDKRGMPWDSRIHASTRAKKIDGNWKNKRGVDANLIAQVEATYGPLAPAAAAPAVSPPAATVQAAPVPPPPTAGSAAPAAAVPSVALDFRGLMQKIQINTLSGKISADQVNAALAAVGLKPEEMAQLINNAPLISSVNATIDACLT